MAYAALSSAAIQGDLIEELVAKSEPTVLIIEGLRADGGSTQSSACVVQKDGLILTTAHQVIGIEKLTGRRADGVTFPLSVVEIDEEREIALLRANRTLPAAAALGDARTLSAGALLVTIATPVNLDFTVATGIVANTSRTYRGFPVIQAELTAAPGSSGGPVFNKKGEVVGLIMGVLEEQDWVTIIIPINNAYSMLERHGVYRASLPSDFHEQELAPVSGISQVELRALEAYNNGTKTADAAGKAIYYKRAVEFLPAFYEAWFNLAVAAHNAGDQETALKAYQQALALRSESVEARRNLGRLHIAMGNFAEAIRLFEEVVSLRPAAPQSYNDLAEAYRKAGDTHRAITLFNEAIAQDERYTNALFNLGLTYVQSNEWELAYDAFERYLAAAPGAADREKVKSWMDSIKERLKH